MVSRVWLFGLLLVVPLIGFGVAEAIQMHHNSELRSVLRQQYPQATESQLGQFTVDRLCEDPTAGSREFCEANSNLNLMSLASLGAGAVGLLLLALIRTAGILARNSRSFLVVLFRLGLYLTVVVLIGLVLVHAAVAIAAIYYGESALIGRIHVGIILAIGLGAVIGVFNMARGAFSLIRKAETFVIGYALPREEAPELWKRVDDTADQLHALRPQNLVVGLDPNFFVTEADVACLNGTLSGRTLYCSLPLCRVLTKSELTSILGHELGHFKGMDTKFSERFYPIYRGTASSLSSLLAASGEGSGALALLPAIAVLSYFLESFSVAESRLSRERELAADQAGASVTSSSTIATALVKIHAFAGMWEGIQEAAANALREHKGFINASKAYAEAVRESAAPHALDGIAESHLSHPTDSHPTLAVRLDSLQTSISLLANAALDVTPVEPAIALIPDPEGTEETISETYQLILARSLGIDLSSASPLAADGVS
jgi:Zn-dependent protease with chaperone function